MRHKPGKAGIHSGAEQRDHCGTVRAITKQTLDAENLPAYRDPKNTN